MLDVLQFMSYELLLCQICIVFPMCQASSTKYVFYTARKELCFFAFRFHLSYLLAYYSAAATTQSFF